MKPRLRTDHRAATASRERRAILPRARRAILPLALLLFISSLPARAQQQPAPQTPPPEAPTTAARTYKFVNGQWFDGGGFKPKTFYAAGGLLTEKAPRQVDEVIDLGGGYVVPPFGDAHNHNIEKEYNLGNQIRAYLRDGIYYVKIPNSIHQFSSQIAGKLNHPASVDVVFANGGLTSAGGHPVRLYEDILSQHAYRGVTKGWFDNKAYFTIDSEADLEAKWPQIVAARPNFIKTYLLYSDEYEKRRADQTYYGRRGLDPRLLPRIVERAHRAGLRVTTHVETVADFRTALAAGVDEINHLPAHYLPTTQPAERFRLSEEDARETAKRGVVVVTTTMVGKLREKEPARVKALYEAQTYNLRLLHKHGAPIAIGTDNYALTSLSEVMNLHEMKAFDNLTLLKLWCETTARAIFPERRIGRLKQGYEASFLVLGGNPIENFEHVKAIRARFKQGRPVTLEEATATR